YLVITGYDTLAFRTLKIPSSRGSIVLGSFVSFAYSNMIGFGAITNASIRYHIHRHAGVSLKDSTKVVAFYSLTLLLGMLCVGSVVFLFSPVKIPLSFHLPFRSMQPFAWMSMSMLVLYIWLLTRRGKPLKIWHWTIPHMPLHIVLFQVLLASADWMLSGAAAYVLIPHSAVMSYTDFMSIYVVAQLAGMFSQVPGGVGVFETIMLLLLPRVASTATTVGTLLAFRAIFYVVPFLLATLLLGKFEWTSRRKKKLLGIIPR
ncbi:MAG TPA: lysylphosphatidylglycerol synthase domain-containing protein, partial [Candidatus Peribacteria bacterium]|nr:lysylphosphatidylglycerol synthase domain-containing protein [Candidatus Peribacteria bacterium]